MRILRLPKRADNQKGVVMMMVLLIATITLSVTTTMLYMLLTSTKFSGMQNRFATSMEAAVAGTEAVTEFISYGNSASFVQKFNDAGMSFGYGDNVTCIEEKLKESTASWSAACSNDLYINPLDGTSYDVHFELGDYLVYGKIVYTIKGNTGGGGAIRRFANTCVTDCGIGFGGQAVPFTYTVEVLAKHRDILTETSRMSVLYQK